MTSLLDDAAEFAGWLAIIYAATVAAYFSMNTALSALNRRNPERRIQKNRSGEERRATEIR